MTLFALRPDLKMSLIITGIAPNSLLLIGEQFEIRACKLRRGLSHQVDVCVASDKAEQGLEGVGGESVAAVVRHVSHEDGDGVGEHSGEQLSALDTGLQFARAAWVLVVVQVLGEEAAGLARQHVNITVYKATPLVGGAEIGILLTRCCLDF